jgi:WD40 repeat protein
LCVGATVRGLNIHPDGLHIVYPLGCKVVVQNWKTKNQVFLSGHTNAISAIAISPNGKYIASGQITDMGFKVSIDILSVLTVKATIMHTEKHVTSANHGKMSNNKNW